MTDITVGSRPLEKLIDLICETTAVYRKGAEVTRRNVNGVDVIEIYGYDPVPDDGLHFLVDVHFVMVGVRGVEGETAEKLREALREYPEPERLAGGPSYIELGGVLGSQELALRLLALGEACKLWKVITPAALHIEGPQADEMAGSGFVMCSGYKSDPEAALKEAL